MKPQIIVISMPPIGRDSVEYFFRGIEVHGTRIVLQMTSCPFDATLYEGKESAESQIQVLRMLRIDAEMGERRGCEG